MAHGLEMPAHDAVGHHGLAVFHDHTRNNRMHRALARGDAVGMAAFHPETEAAILQHHTGFIGENAAAKTLEQRVNKAARIAVPIDDGEVDRVLMHGQHRLPRRRHMFHGFFIGNQAAQAGQVLFAAEMRHGHIGLGRIGEEGIAVTVCQARRLDMAM